MKILKIFGLVVGIHVFALVLIFANPGCSSTRKPAPSPADTVTAPPPSVSVPIVSTPPPSATADPFLAPTPAPAGFNPDAPAVAGPAVRFTPTRPGTPVASTLVAAPVADVIPATTYTVKTGDSLWSIAKKNRLTVAQLTAANSLPANAYLRPGQKLLIPGKDVGPTGTATAPAVAAKSAEPAVTRPAANGKGIVHVVKSGETLGAIARKYDLRTGDIAVANNITDPAKIRAGMELVIPGWEKPVAKSGKAKAVSAAPAEPVPSFTPEPFAPPADTTNTPPPIPIIRIDESPITPAPVPKTP
jgi:LysM repeat protein